MSTDTQITKIEHDILVEAAALLLETIPFMEDSAEVERCIPFPIRPGDPSAVDLLSRVKCWKRRQEST